MQGGDLWEGYNPDAAKALQKTASLEQRVAILEEVVAELQKFIHDNLDRPASMW
jgi:hypothetical protein